MARSRNIKPGFFTNDELGELEPLARLLFAGLWCHADREGRLKDRPKKLKAEILPYDDCDIHRLVQCLHDAGFVLRYVVDGIGYIQILKFGEHQNPHVKEADSDIPPPTGTSKAPDKNETKTADSLNPLTDSLQKHCPAKPDVLNGSKAEAIEILDYLNRNAGRRFRPVEANLKFIVGRLKSGATALQCREIIFAKCEKWKGDPKMAEYLRPETLFNATKFESYLGELNNGVS